MRLNNTLLLTIIILAIGCHRYPSIKQLKKECIKEDKELTSKFTPGSLPNVFLNNHVGDIYLKTGWYFITDSTHGFPRKIYRETENNLFYVDTVLQLSPKDIEIFCLSPDHNNEEVINLLMYFDEEGTKKWEIVTEKSTDENLAFIINNILLIAPKVNCKITGGTSVLWGNNYTAEEMFAIKTLLLEQKNNNK